MERIRICRRIVERQCCYNGNGMKRIIIGNKNNKKNRTNHNQWFVLRTFTSSLPSARQVLQLSDLQTYGNRFNMLAKFNSSCRPFSSSGANTGGFFDKEAVTDLFDQYAQERFVPPTKSSSLSISMPDQDEKEDDGSDSDKGRLHKTLDIQDLHNLLLGIGRKPDLRTLEHLFQVADLDGNGTIDSKEFIENADALLGDSPARIILVIGGPGSGKGSLSQRLQAECNVVHLSSGDLLRQEVEQDTSLGRTVRGMMSRGELVSSAIMVALMKKRMRDHYGKRVLLDGFPRSPENARDLVTLCGKPELALHLVCDDTILMERIMKRGEKSGTDGLKRREDDNFYAALKRLRTFHQFHGVTLEWLKAEHIPIVNLDCSGNHESVWQQLVAIGRLMRPAVRLPSETSIFGEIISTTNGTNNNKIKDKSETITDPLTSTTTQSVA